MNCAIDIAVGCMACGIIGNSELQSLDSINARLLIRDHVCMTSTTIRVHIFLHAWLCKVDFTVVLVVPCLLQEQLQQQRPLRWTRPTLWITMAFKSQEPQQRSIINNMHYYRYLMTPMQIARTPSKPEDCNAMPVQTAESDQMVYCLSDIDQPSKRYAIGAIPATV